MRRAPNRPIDEFCGYPPPAMSFMNSMKKAAASAVSQIMEEPGARSEPMNAELEGIEASLQAQLKELKAFVTGMNSTLNAALAAAQLYREEGGDRALADAVRCRRPCRVAIDGPRRHKTPPR